MTTMFKDFIEQTYANHRVRLETNPPLSAHSVVGVAELDPQSGLTEHRDWATDLGSERVACAVVEPTQPTLVPQGGEDPEGVIDLPKRRVATSAIIGGGAVGIVVGVIVGIISTVGAGVITGVFSSVVVGMFAAIAGGGARFAGQRAWRQPNKPTSAMLVVAGFADEEDEANAIARQMEQLGISDVRIVSEEGAWHLPNT